MEFRQVGEALDSARRLGMIGGEVGCSPFLDTGSNETADCGKLVERAAPAGNEGTGALCPGQSAALGGQGVRRVRLVVIHGGAASKARRAGAAPRRSAASLCIVTVNGKRVHQFTASA